MKHIFDIATALRSLTVALLLAFATPAAAAVTAAIMPSTVIVTPGSEFDVTLEVTLPGSAFNAFSSIVAFDPDALTPISITPLSDQVGNAMKAACPTEFNDFQILASTVKTNCSMLCAGASMTGPGAYYRLRFKASETLQQTNLTFNKMEFILEGATVTPSTATGALIVIAVPVEISQFSID